MNWQKYGLTKGTVTVTWSEEPTIESIATLMEYLAMHRRILEFKATQAPRPDQPKEEP